jgi:hypothetical protein
VRSRNDVLMPRGGPVNRSVSSTGKPEVEEKRGWGYRRQFEEVDIWRFTLVITTLSLFKARWAAARNAVQLTLPRGSEEPGGLASMGLHDVSSSHIGVGAPTARPPSTPSFHLLPNPCSLFT